MGRIAFLFPGQASQSVGMDSVLRGYPEAASLLDMTDELSGIEGLARIIAEGPAELLTRTDNVQPGITMVSLAALAVLRGAGITPGAVAGHSLGEYSALTASGVISPEDAVALTRVRGRLMQECADRYPGGMLALLGIDEEAAARAVAEASALGPVGVANINSPGQVVISGAEKPLERAGELCSQAGARRVIPLQVSGAWHSPLMEEAAEGLWEVLKDTGFHDPEVPVVANVTAGFITSGDESRTLLRRQVTSPVLWAGSMQLLVDEGFDTFVEVGPGRVLQGLLARNRDIRTYGTGDAESMGRVLDELA
jgi:[acyl-carrier-protein] S-malonyltransferase